MAEQDFPSNIGRRRLLISAAAFAAFRIEPDVECTEAAKVTTMAQPLSSAPGDQGLNVCAATARRLLEIERRNLLRAEANLPLLSIAKELRRVAVIGAALIGEYGVRDVTIVRATMLRPSISRPFDIRLRPWAFRPHIGLLSMGFGCATLPVVASAIRIRGWPPSRVLVGFNRQYVRSGHYGEVCDFFGPC